MTIHEFQDELFKHGSYDKLFEHYGWVTYMNNDNYIYKAWIEERKPYEKMGVPRDALIGFILQEEVKQ